MKPPSSFGFDTQTKQDLNIFPRAKGDISVFDFYNQTNTKGGRTELAEMMRIPLTALAKIKSRLATISFIKNHQISFVFDSAKLDFISN